MVERCLSFRVRRFLMLVLVVMLSFGPITRAYADDFEGGGGASQSFNSRFGTVWYGPTASGLYVRYGVVANTRYDAAVYCCRGRSFDLNDLTPTKKSKLLNDADFRQFAQLFNASKPELTDDWSGDASIVMAWDSARQLYGETYCWNARYTNDQKIRAQEAIEDVLNDDDTPSGGGSGSGGSGSGSGSTGYIEEETTVYYNEYSNVSKFGGRDDFVVVTSPVKERIDEIIDTLLNSWNGNCNWILAFPRNNSEFIFWPNGMSLSLNDSEKLCLKNNTSESLQYAYINTSNTGFSGNTVTMQGTSGSLQYVTVNAGSSASLSSLAYISVDYDGDTGSGDGGGGGGDEPTEPPIEWPTPPTETPQPPEVPTPGDPTTPTPPDPVDPTPGNPWIPIPDDDVQITGQDFQDLIDALNEHCIHLQNAIQTNISQLWDLQSDFLGTQFEDLFGLISDNFEWLGNDVITDSYNDLKSYLYDLFEWLSEQLNFDVQVEGGQYDDTSVLYWLKQIWAKLPTGINTRPTDPVTNPDGWWDWLTQLLNNLAADLMALGHDELAGVLETLNELRNKFPFSLPWDVAALLGLLVGVPECPEFDMPCYTVSLQGLQEVGTYHVTLEPYETVWEGVKWIETLAFAVYLIMNTGGLMDMVTKTVRPR